MTAIIEIARDTKFEAAHYLPYVPPGHKCARMHGHTYRLTAVWRGRLDVEVGWVIDFGELADMLQPLLDLLDHHLLNDYVDNPTCENVLLWLWKGLAGYDTGSMNLIELRLRETDTSWAVYRGEQLEEEGVDRSWRQT